MSLLDLLKRGLHDVTQAPNAVRNVAAQATGNHIAQQNAQQALRPPTPTPAPVQTPAPMQQAPQIWVSTPPAFKPPTFTPPKLQVAPSFKPPQIQQPKIQQPNFNAFKPQPAPQIQQQAPQSTPGIHVGNQVVQQAPQAHTSMPQPVNNVPSLMQNIVHNSVTKNPIVHGMEGAGLAAARSLGGTVQSVYGAADALSPGTGTSRFSKATVGFNKALDTAAHNEHVNPAIYHGGQALGDLGQFAVGSGEINAGLKAAETIPKIGTAVRAVGRVSPFIEGKVATALAPTLERGNIGQRLVARGIQNIAKPGYQAANAAFTGTQLAKEASQGQQITPGSVAQNLAIGGLGFPLAGAAAHEATAPIINKVAPQVERSIQALKDKHIIAPSNLSHDEINSLAHYVDKHGAGIDDQTYTNGVAAAQKAGIHPGDMQGLQKLVDAHAEYQGNRIRLNKPLTQDGHVRPFGSKQNPEAIRSQLGTLNEQFKSLPEGHPQRNALATKMDQLAQGLDEADVRALQEPKTQLPANGRPTTVTKAADAAKALLGDTQEAADTGYRSSHQVTDGVPVHQANVDQLASHIKSKYGLTNSDHVDIKRLKTLAANPEADVKIYRASPKNELNHGDWVTNNKTYANDIKRQNGGKVYEHTVKAKELHLPANIEDNPSLARFSAFQFNKGAEAKVVPPLPKELHPLAEEAKPLAEKAKTFTSAADFKQDLRPTERDVIRKMYPDLPEAQKFAQFFQDNGVATKRLDVKATPTLINEAKKHDTAQSFIDKMTGSATQYGEYNPELRHGGTTGSRLSELGVHPDKKVTIYRGIDDPEGKIRNKSIRNGDFVTADYQSALSYTGDPRNVVSTTVPAKHLFSEDDAAFKDEPFAVGHEYIYSKNTKAQKPLSAPELKQIWEDAKGYTAPNKGIASDQAGSLNIGEIGHSIRQAVKKFSKPLDDKGSAPLIEDGSMIPTIKKLTGGKQVAPHEAYAKNYGEALQQMEQGLSGGQMIPDGTGGYTRISEHSPFYRKYYAENGRVPSKAAYHEEAIRQLESGKADSYAQKEYDDLKNPEVASLLTQGDAYHAPDTTVGNVLEPQVKAPEAPAAKPVKQSQPKAAPTKLPGEKASGIASSKGTPKLPVERTEAPLPEYGTKQVSKRDLAFRSTRSIIERQGEHGQALASELQKARDTEEIYQAKLAKQLPTVRSLKGKDFENFVEATQGKVQANSPKVEQAIKEWQAVHPGIRERAVKAGLDVGDLGPKYYPHFIDYEKIFKDKNTFNTALNHLVDTGQAKTPEEAMTLLNHAKDVSRNRSFGNLEAQRLVDLPMYDKTPNSLVSYLQSSAHRIAQTEHFGAKDEKALKLIAKAGQQGHDTEAMKNAYDVAVGAKQYGHSASNEFLRKARTYQSTTRLGLGALTNASQNVNTGIVTGHIRTLGAMVKQLNPKTRSFVEDTGVIGDAVLNDIKTQAGFTGKVLSKLTAPGFSQVEKFNRSVAATAGRDYALRLAQKGKEGTLRKLGVTGDIKNGTLTEDQQVQAARKIVEKTQFKVDAQDLPGWADSPGGKLVSQFRTFSYSQGKFFSNEVLKPAAKGNVLPLGRLIASLPVGYGLYEAKRGINGRPEETDKKKVGLQAFSNVGGAGLVLDIYQSLNPTNSKYLPSDRRVSMAVSALGGPTAGLATQAAGAVSDLIQRKNVPSDPSRLGGKVVIGKTDKSYTDATQAARFALNQIPIVGGPIRNRVLPYKAQSQADTGTTGGGTPVAQLKATEKQQNKDLKASLSPEDYQLSTLGKADRQKLIDQGKYTQAKFDSLDTFVNNKRKQLGMDVKGGTAPKLSNTVQAGKSEQDYAKDPKVQQARKDMLKNLPKDMNGNDVATLERFTGIPAGKKQDILAHDNSAEYKLKLAEFERDKKLGKINGTQQESRQAELQKAQVGADFTPETRNVYGMSKEKATVYLANHPKGDELAKQVITYGDHLAQAGIESNKFVNKKGQVSIEPKGTLVEAHSGRISQAAKKNGVDEKVFAALVRQESGGNQGAVSPVGAIGLTQLMPATAKTLGVDPRNPDQNLDGGAKYLKQMKDKFGSWELALAAYNAGPGAVEKYHGIPPYAETQNYVKNIMGMVKGGIKGNDLNLVLNDPKTSGGGLAQSGVDTSSSSGKAKKISLVDASVNYSGTSKLASGSGTHLKAGVSRLASGKTRLRGYGHAPTNKVKVLKGKKRQLA